MVLVMSTETNPETLTERVYDALTAAYAFSRAADAQNAIANLKDEVRERPLTQMLRETLELLVSTLGEDEGQ